MKKKQTGNPIALHPTNINNPKNPVCETYGPTGRQYARHLYRGKTCSRCGRFRV